VAHVVVGGDALRTRYAATPAFVVSAIDDGPVSLKMSFNASETRPGELALFTRMTFQDVLEYRWMAFNQAYAVSNRDDFGFALIEILASGMIASMESE